MVKQDDQVQYIADKIERYFKEHPNAKDSLEGIRSWWLQGGVAEWAPSQVQKALDHLVEYKKIFRKRVPGDRFVYSGSKDNLKKKN
jgi:hypothetical protein